MASLVKGSFPSTYDNPQNRRWHPFLSRIRTFLVYREICGKRISYDEIVGLIQSLSVEYWINIASKGRLFLEHYENKPEYQGIPFHYLCPQSLLEVEIKTYDAKDRFFFHRTQFLALLRLALLHGCSPPRTEVSEEGLQQTAQQSAEEMLANG